MPAAAVASLLLVLQLLPATAEAVVQPHVAPVTGYVKLRSFNQSTLYHKVGAGVSEQWGVSEHLLVASYLFFETTPPLLLVGLHVEATTSNRTAHF